MGDFGGIDWSKTKFNVDTSDLIPTSFKNPFFNNRRAGENNKIY